jgi:hypothetical protein
VARIRSWLGRRPSGPSEPSAALVELRRRIDGLGGADARPVVPLEAFFEGNDDLASIGPNLDPHPGVSTFYRVLREIRSRAEVADVLVQIDEVLGGDEWPFVPIVYVITTASPEAVHGWAGELQPDDYVPAGDDGWVGGVAPPGAPEVAPGFRVVGLFWD